MDQGADDYLTKPFSARELIARVRVNIKLSYLRRQLLLQQRHQTETKQLLFSISNTIHSGFNLEKTLSTAVEEVHNILPCDRIYVVTEDEGDSRINAYSATDKDERNLRGELVFFNMEENHLTESSNIQQNSDDAKELEVVRLPNYYSLVVQKEVSLVALQIKINSKTWGWLVANRPPNSTWLDSEIMFLQQILNQISLAVTHSILLEEKLKKEAQVEAARAANEAKSQILANTSHGLYFYLFTFFNLFIFM